MSRRINNVDAVVVPHAGCGSRGDGDASLLLLLHPVHGGRAFVHFADLVVLAGVKEDTLSGCGLAGVDVGHDTNVTVLLKGPLSLSGVCMERQCGIFSLLHRMTASLKVSSSSYTRFLCIIHRENAAVTTTI